MALGALEESFGLARPFKIEEVFNGYRWRSEKRWITVHDRQDAEQVQSKLAAVRRVYLLDKFILSGFAGFPKETSPTTTQPRGRNRAWHGESVSGGSLRTRRSALCKLSSEIGFAFRAPASNSASNDNDDVVVSGEPTYSGDYVAALQIQNRTLPESSSNSWTTSRKRLVHGDKDREDRLMWDVNDLRQELQRLRDHKRALATRRVYRSIATRATVYRVTNEYFAMFENGFERGPLAHRHEAFLRSVVDPEILMCATLRGVDALVEQWRRYTDYFELRSYKLRTVHATSLDDAPLLEIECGYDVFITWQTLEALFPHILSDPYLVQRIVGKNLTCDSRVTFVFNDAGKIVWYDDYSDFVAAFARLLRNTKDLATLMGQARITDQSLIGEIESNDTLTLVLPQDGSVFVV